jgi:transposase
MGQVTVFSGPERRRRWSDEERLRILPRRLRRAPWVADVCRRHGVSSGLIYTWRRKLLAAGAAQEADVPEALPTPVFAEASDGRGRGGGPHGRARRRSSSSLPRGKRVSIFAAASPALVTAALKALR